MELIVFGYPDTHTAVFAMEELEQGGAERAIRRDDAAVLVRDERGGFTSITSAVIPSDEPSWTMFWGTLFAILFFAPCLGMPIGADLARLTDRVQGSGLDPQFRSRVRDLVAPGTSALFVLLDGVAVERIVDAVDEFGGTVLRSRLSRDAVVALQATLGRGSDVA